MVEKNTAQWARNSTIITGKAEHRCPKIISWGKPLLTFDHPENANLVAMGAKPVET